MPKPRRNHRHPSESSSQPGSQSQQDDVLASMMSPATKLLLANMNRSSRAGASANNSNDTSNSHPSKTTGDADESSSRRPLGAIQEANTKNNTHKSTESMPSSKLTATNSKRTTPIKSNRTIGPHEAKYTQNYDAYITQTIHRYESKLQSNIGKQNSLLLPSYKRMNGEERSDALARVDNLLERLTLGSTTDNNKGGVASLKQSSAMDSNDETVLDTQASSNNGGAAYNHDNNNDQSFGSATTMGGHGNNPNQNTTMNKSTSSETTMMEQSMSLLGTTSNNTTIHTRSIMDGSTTMEQSMSLLGDDGNTSRHHARKSLESDATTAYEQSMSLLGNESHLLPPSGGGGINDEEEDDDDESRFSRGGDLAMATAAAAAAPIEKVRRYQPNDSNNDDRMMTSPQFTSSFNNKRCASNSGKRGLKSRLRYQDDDNDVGDFTADDSLLQRFDHGSNDDDLGAGGLFFASQDDEFSPIPKRFSHDGLESDCGIDRYDDDDNDDASRGNKYGRNEMLATQQEGGEDDDVSFGCNDGGFDNDDDDYDGDYGGSNWTQSSRPLTQQHQQQQQSQWSTFKTVDPATQTNEEESPVKRRAIRFESTQKGYARHQRKERGQVVRDDDNEKIQSMRNELADMVVRDQQVGADQGDDPIQTVGNLCRRARSCNEEGMDTSLLDEVAPIDVRLRDGHLFHKDPLQCRQVQKKKSSSKAKSKGAKTVRIAKGSGNVRHSGSDSEASLSDPDPSFKDPTSSFPSRVADRLNGAFDFMMESDGQSTTSAAAIAYPDDCGDQNAGLILSLDLKQTMAVTSKLLLTTKKVARSHRNSKNRKTASTPSTAIAAPSRGGDYLAGGTLIILRAKEDIPIWEAALREYTSLSVFSHNSLQANQRKNASTAAKCAVYDVVLTTYDLLKSKEATISVDSLGKAILNSDSKSAADDGGWLKTRGSQTQSGGEAKKTCLHLSILLRMSWYQVIMMDSLGRKGYLTKADTARAQAATAVNSLSRFIFFVKEEDDAKMENKFKNERKQIKSVLQALHLPSGTTAKTFLGRWAHDVKSNVKESSLDSSSCDDRSMSDDYGSDAN
eukprot:scaffold4601_cov156-Skeletonema_marinoi.AAC.1